jgi:flagellar hook protein FlgE
MTERSLLAAVSGIDANQTYLDSISNNIANSNTVGYKESDVQFEDLLNEQLEGATAPITGSSAGVDPLAIGSGVRIGATTTDLSEGTLNQTGQSSDVAIQGNGFLVVDQGGNVQYTRDGNLTVDANGNLATENGGLIQGWQANAAGTINTSAALTPITIAAGETVAANPTANLTIGGNLPAWSGSGTAPVETTTIDGYDSLGDTVPITLTFTGVAATANEWTIQGTVPKPSGGTDTLFTTAPTITFDPTTGQVKAVSGVTQAADGTYTLPVTTMPAGYSFPASDTWDIDFPAPGSSGAVTQYAGASTIAITNQDGHASGTLQSYSIGTDGVITGAFSDGSSLPLGQIALAGFNNPAGLADQGTGLFSTTPDSGQPQIGTAGVGTLGQLLGGELEESNVNLGSELTDLITAQEAYEANTKVLTTTQTVISALESVA